MARHYVLAARETMLNEGTSERLRTLLVWGARCESRSTSCWGVILSNPLCYCTTTSRTRDELLVLLARDGSGGGAARECCASDHPAKPHLGTLLKPPCACPNKQYRPAAACNQVQPQKVCTL